MFAQWVVLNMIQVRLTFDKKAFYFFFVALWLAALIPFTLSALRAFKNANKSIDLSQVAPTFGAYENTFVNRLVKKRKEKILAENAEARAGAVKRLTFAAVGWALVLAYLFSRESGADIQKFDPFEILGISPSASELEIKKAYKKLSLIHHPDRWANKDKADQALAETRFIMVAKAYEALTDPIARENFQKYGNPDGRQALEMSIGLPAWLLEKENQTWVIGSYLLLSIIVFPAGVVLITANASRSGGLPKRLFPDTEEIFRFAIRTEYCRQFNAMAEVFAMAAEFRSLVYRSEDEKTALLDLRNQLVRKEKYPLKPSPAAVALFKQVPSLKTSEGNEKTLILLWVHLNRLHNSLSEELQDDLEFILSRAPVIVRALIQHARVTCHIGVLSNAIFFQQHLYQATLPTAHFLQQFPHIPDEDADYLTREVQRALKMKPENKRSALQELFFQKTQQQQTIKILEDEKQQKDFDQVLERFPFKDIGLALGTIKEVISKGSSKSKDPRNNEYVFEKESAQGDFIRIIVDLQEQNANHVKGPTKGKDYVVAHTPFMPVEIPEEYHVVVLGGPNPRGFNQMPMGENKVTAFTTLEDDGKPTLRADLQFLTFSANQDWMSSADWPVGRHRVFIWVFPSCYHDNHKMAAVEFQLVDPAKLPKYKVHEEDERLKSEPTSLYAMLQPQAEPEVDSDFEDGTEGNEADDAD